MYRVCLAWAVFLLCVVSIFLYPAHSQADGEDTAGPVKVGAILHLTGDLAMQGVAFQEGIELAVENINKSGGISGRAVKVIYEDTGFINTNVHRAAKKLIEQDKVSVAIISTFHESKIAGPLFERAQIPLLCLWDSTPELENMGEYLFSIGIWLPATGKTTAQFAFTNLQAKKAAVISTNREWSLRVGSDFAEQFKNFGGSIVFKDAYNPGESDFRSVFLKIKQTQPDVLYAPVDDNIGTFFKQLRESRLDIPIIQSDNLNQEWINNLGSLLEGVYQSQGMEPTNTEVGVMAKQYREKFGKEPTQILFQGWGYDGLNIIAKAMETEGVSPNAIKSGLYQIADYPGTIGKISINREGSHRVGVKMFQIRNGVFITLGE
jgi:branched-chain amino acid transport system substrate-binding protein